MVSEDEQQIGTVSFRRGRWVVRPATDNSEFVQEVLAILQGANCHWAPEPGGLLSEGRERVTYIEGLTGTQLRSSGGDPYALQAASRAIRWMRLLHDVTSLTRFGVVCHGAVGPDNLIFDESAKPIGLIGWILAHPGKREDDLRNAIKQFANGDSEFAGHLIDTYGRDVINADLLA